MYKVTFILSDMAISPHYKYRIHYSESYWLYWASLHIWHQFHRGEGKVRRKQSRQPHMAADIAQVSFLVHQKIKETLWEWAMGRALNSAEPFEHCFLILLSEAVLLLARTSIRAVSQGQRGHGDMCVSNWVTRSDRTHVDIQEDVERKVEMTWKVLCV